MSGRCLAPVDGVNSSMKVYRDLSTYLRREAFAGDA
jgi:hypothetical protein